MNLRACTGQKVTVVQVHPFWPFLWALYSHNARMFGIGETSMVGTREDEHLAVYRATIIVSDVTVWFSQGYLVRGTKQPRASAAIAPKSECQSKYQLERRVRGRRQRWNRASQISSDEFKIKNGVKRHRSIEMLQCNLEWQTLMIEGGTCPYLLSDAPFRPYKIFASLPLLLAWGNFRFVAN
jgi:hypothetical protein